MQRKGGGRGCGTRRRTLFVTVGTTKFKKLIAQISKKTFVDAIYDMGFRELRVQYGPRGDPPDFDTLVSKGDITKRRGISNSTLRWTCLKETCEVKRAIDVQWFPIKDSISQDLRDADLVVGHAGAGTILETLRSGTKLLVVSNEELMDNHQFELAGAMAERGFLAKSSLKNLISDIRRASEKTFRPYPAPKQGVFSAFLERQLGLQ